MKIFLILAVLFVNCFGYSQTSYYSPPLKIPLSLSASFAELRSNHFHSGIDIKTMGKAGIPVYAVADGFISRISVSSTGFGNALYIDHYNGTTSVYGHLQEFRDDIQDYIRKIQYRKKSFKVDVQVSPEDFLVSKDELIAKSGNSGSSGGPHLHFELRDTKSEEPLNPLQYGFNVADNTSPRFSSVQIYPLSNDSHVNYQAEKRRFSLIFHGGKYRIQNNPVIPVYGNIGVAIEANDFFDNSWNRCGISTMVLKLDNKVHFQIDLNRFSFSQSRFINSYVDYMEWISNQRWFQKTWIDPGNQLQNYVYENDSGILNFMDENKHTVEVEIKDAYKNTSVLTFFVETKPKEIIKVREDFNAWFDYDQDNLYQTNDFKIEIPKGALYTSIGFHHKIRTGPNDCFSDIHEVNRNTVPLHRNAEISIKTSTLEKYLQEKAFLVIVDKETGNYWNAGGKYEEGWVKTESNTFGDYAVYIDTIPPTIRPLSIEGHKSLTESNRIRFVIKDDIAGIKSYTGSLDGNWALFEYDAKNELLTHYFDNERFELKKRHNLKLVVTDNRDNSAVYEASFWK